MRYKQSEEFLQFLDDYLALLKKHNIAYTGTQYDVYDAISVTKEIITFLEYVKTDIPNN